MSHQIARRQPVTVAITKRSAGVECTLLVRVGLKVRMGVDDEIWADSREQTRLRRPVRADDRLDESYEGSIEVFIILLDVVIVLGRLPLVHRFSSRKKCSESNLELH